MNKLKLFDFYLKPFIIILISSLLYLDGWYRFVILILSLYLLDCIIRLSKYWNKANVNPIKIKVLRCNNARNYLTIVKTLSFPQQLSLYSEYHELALTNKEYQLMRTNIQ